MKLLLQNGADVNTVTNGGKTALRIAAEQGHDNIVKTLIRNAPSTIMILYECRNTYVLCINKVTEIAVSSHS